MIRIVVAQKDLYARIEAHKAGWLAKAAARTRWLLGHKTFTTDKLTGPSVPSWSDIKQVYRDLQGNNCAYCESPMEGQDDLAVGAGVHDVEHFRPKKGSVAWQKRQGNDDPPDGLRSGRAKGYY